MFEDSLKLRFLEFGNGYRSWKSGSRFSSKYMDRGPFFLLFWLPVHHGLRKGLLGLYVYAHTCFISVYYGNLKRESVVVANLPLHMKVSYCTSGFFCSYARQAILLSVCCLSCVDLHITHTFRLSCDKHVATISWPKLCRNDCTKSEGTITHLHTWPSK